MSVGELKIHVKIQLPAEKQDVWFALNHELAIAEICVAKLICTRIDGDRIAERVRAANPTVQFRVSWTGDVDL